MFMCVVNLKSVNKLDLTWKQSFLIARLVFSCKARAYPSKAAYIDQLLGQYEGPQPKILAYRRKISTIITSFMVYCAQLSVAKKINFQLRPDIEFQCRGPMDKSCPSRKPKDHHRQETER